MAVLGIPGSRDTNLTVPRNSWPSSFDVLSSMGVEFSSLG